MVPIWAYLAAGAAGSEAREGWGIGKNNMKALTYDQHPVYNPNAFNLGGAPGYGYERAADYRMEAMGAQGRAGPQLDYTYVDEDRRNAMGARAGQARIASLMEGRASGLVPSISRMSGDRAMQQAEAAQLSGAASARGAGALALAQQNAAMGTASAQQNIAAQTQIAEAQERLAAEQAAFGAMTGLRGSDFQSQGLAQQWAGNQAALEMQQRQLNDQYALGLYGYENTVQQQQLQAQLAHQGLMQGSHASTDAVRAGVSSANAQNEWMMARLALGAASSGASAAATGSTSSGLTAEPPQAPPPNPMMQQQAYGGVQGAPAPNIGQQRNAMMTSPAYFGIGTPNPRPINAPMVGRPVAAMQPLGMAPAPRALPARPQPQAMGLAPQRPPPQPGMFDPRGRVRAA